MIDLYGICRIERIASAFPGLKAGVSEPILSDEEEKSRTRNHIHRTRNGAALSCQRRPDIDVLLFGWPAVWLSSDDAGDGVYESI